MSEKIVHLNEEVIKSQISELVRGSVEETLIAVVRYPVVHDSYSRHGLKNKS